MSTWVSRCTGLLLMIPAPAFAAGLTFTQVTTAEGGRDAANMNMTMLVQADNGQARMEWKGAANPVFTEGSYLLAKDGGQSVYLVRPDKKTYAPFEIGYMSGSMSSMMDTMAKTLAQQGCKMEVVPPTIEKLLEEAGPEIAGYATSHFRYHTVSGSKLTCSGALSAANTALKLDSLEDVWTTSAIDVGAIAKFFSGFGGARLDESAKKVVDAERAKMTGFPLRRIVVSKTDGSGRMARGGSSGETKLTTEAKDIKVGPVHASVFEIPSDYTETQMMQRGPAMPDINSRPPR